MSTGAVGKISYTRGMKKKFPQKSVHWARLRESALVTAGCSRQFGSGGEALARDLSTLRDEWVTLAHVQMGVRKQPKTRWRWSVLALL